MTLKAFRVTECLFTCLAGLCPTPRQQTGHSCYTAESLYMRFFLHWALSVVLFLLLSENVLWLLDFPLGVSGYIGDKECCWILSPGLIQSSEDPSVFETILPNGMRRARQKEDTGKPYRVLVMGDSYTFGIGVHEEDTYVWKLNNLIPNVEFDNGAVGGYGPHQVLMLLRHYIQRKRYDMVMFATMPDHFNRCTVPKVRSLEFPADDKRHHSYSTMTTMPFVELVDGFRFVDHPLSRVDVPFSRQLVLSNFLSSYLTARYVRSFHMPSDAEKDVIFAEIINRQAMISAAYGCPYLLVALTYSTYPTHLFSSHVCYYDASFPHDLRDEDRVLCNPMYHPNSKVHTYWAHKLAEFLSNSDNFSYLVAHPWNRQHRTMYDLRSAQGEDPKLFDYSAEE